MVVLDLEWWVVNGGDLSTVGKGAIDGDASAGVNGGCVAKMLQDRKVPSFDEKFIDGVFWNSHDFNHNETPSLAIPGQPLF